MLYFSTELEEEISSELNLAEDEKITQDHINGIENIELSAEDLTGLHNLKNLNHLTISPDEIPENLSKEIPWLKSLEVRNSGIEDKDLVEIAELDNLVSLFLSDNENITTLNPLQCMRSLRSLDLSDNWRFSLEEEGTIKELAKFTALEELCIDNIPISTIDFLTPLVNLKALAIADDGCNSTLEDISFLSAMKNLEDLNIWDHEDIKDYSVLKELDCLKEVYLNRSNLEANNQMEIVDFLKSRGCAVELQE